MPPKAGGNERALWSSRTTPSSAQNPDSMSQQPTSGRSAGNSTNYFELLGSTPGGRATKETTKPGSTQSRNSGINPPGSSSNNPGGRAISGTPNTTSTQSGPGPMPQPSPAPVPSQPGSGGVPATGSSTNNIPKKSNTAILRERAILGGKAKAQQPTTATSHTGTKLASGSIKVPAKGKAAAEDDTKMVDAPLPTKKVWTAPVVPKTKFDQIAFEKDFSWAEESIDAANKAQAPEKSQNSKKRGHGGDQHRGRIAGAKKSDKEIFQQREDAKRRKTDNEKIKAETEQKYREMVANYFDGSARGSDCPPGLFRTWNKPKETLIVCKTSKQADGDVEWTHDNCYKTKYGTNSQHPTIEIIKDGKKGSFSIHSDQVRNFANKDFPEDKDQNVCFFNWTFSQEDLRAANAIEHVIKVFAEELYMSDMPVELAQRLIDYMTPSGPKPGLTVYAVQIRRTGPNFDNQPELSAFCEEHRPSMAFIRQNVKAEPELESYIQEIMTNAAVHGPMWFYGFDKKDKGAWPRALKENGAFMHQPWMKKEPDAEHPGPEYVTHPPYKTFRDGKTFRDVHSAALCYEWQAQAETTNKFCGPTHVHEAKVLTIDEDGRVIVDVRFRRGIDREESVPMFKEGASIALKVRGTGDEDTEMAGTEPNVVMDFDASVEESTHDMVGDLRLIFDVKDKEHRLEAGKWTNVSLTTTVGMTSTLRQLNAVDRYSKPIPAGAPGHDIQQIIFGRQMAPEDMTERHPIWYGEHTHPMQQDLIHKYFACSSMNQGQKAMVREVVGTDNPVTLAHGPPGTGKSMTIASTVSIGVICNKNILATAPTNTATRSMHNHIVTALERLRNLDIDHADQIVDFKVIMVPTEGSTLDELQSHVPLSDNPTHLSYHFDTLMKDDLKDEFKSEKKRTTATKWLQLRSRFEKQEDVSDADRQWYKQIFRTNWTRVFDEASVALVVVSTCNNSHVLRDTKRWAAELVIVDEAAVALEADSLIPITLKLGKPSGARHLEKILLVGDPHQLKPVILSEKQNEYIETLDQPLFVRLANNGIPYFYLTINYRMHPRIAKFPGMIQYGWLGCGENTLVESEAYLAAQKFFDTAELGDGMFLKDLRRLPWGISASDAKSLKQDCRRLFFNTRGSRSAPAPGRTSLRNFGNVNAIILAVNGLIAKGVKPKHITILSPYREQKIELGEALQHRVRQHAGCCLDTINIMQGGENEIILLDLTPANEYHGSSIGFLKEWQRMNVALTRAKSALWMFGNFDCWYQELQILKWNPATLNFAYLMMDLMREGDIIDFYPDPAAHPNVAVANKQPVYAADGTWPQEYTRWTRDVGMMPYDRKKWSENKRRLEVAMMITPANRITCEKEMMAKLEDMYKVWQTKEDAWQEEELKRREEERAAAELSTVQFISK